MDNYHLASRNAWLHAKRIAGLTNQDISRMAGWIFRNGIMTGRITQMAWFIEKGVHFPSLKSLLVISRNGGTKFVDTYLEGLLWLGNENENNTG